MNKYLTKKIKRLKIDFEMPIFRDIRQNSTQKIYKILYNKCRGDEYEFQRSI